MGKAKRKPPAQQRCNLGPKGLSRAVRSQDSVPPVGLQMGSASAELCPPHVPFVGTLFKGAHSNDLQICYTFPLRYKAAVSSDTHIRPVVQWPAVSTEFSLTKAPPHTWANSTPTRCTWRLTAHGQAPSRASWPPTILDSKLPSTSGRRPHSAEQNQVGCGARMQRLVHWLQCLLVVFFLSAVLLAVVFFNVSSWSADSGEKMWVFYSA